ncbi:MAG: IclR family transcriptional regulator [Ideonella sp.]|nr:IclR family transcriptional regulator [Ideonella sp.]
MTTRRSNGAEARSGTQSIERVVGLLRVVASRGRSGMRLGDVTAATGLPNSTCHRMLQRLEAEGMVERHPVTRKYLLGPLLHELGLLARPRVHLAPLCEDAMAALAEHTQDTVYLSERRGLEAVCSAKALTLDVGIRRPLGIGAGGLAILCALPPAEADAIIEANAGRYAKLSTLDVEQVRAAVAEGRARGYAYLEGAVYPGTAAVGVAFTAEREVAALSVAAISSRLSEARRASIAAEVQRHARNLTRRLNGTTATAESPPRPAGPAGARPAVPAAGAPIEPPSVVDRSAAGPTPRLAPTHPRRTGHRTDGS